MAGQSKKPPGRHALAGSARDLFGSVIPSKAHQEGRRLILKFLSLERPELDRISFQWDAQSKVVFRQHLDPVDKDRSFKDSPAANALAIFFLDHLCAGFKQPPRKLVLEGKGGSVASTLGYALDAKNGKWGSLFIEKSETSAGHRIDKIFGGKNWGGKPEKHRVIFVNPEWLPSDCIEVHWNGQPLTQQDEIKLLTDRFRRVWELPPPQELELPVEVKKPDEKPPGRTPPVMPELPGEAEKSEGSPQPTQPAAAPEPAPAAAAPSPGQPKDDPQAPPVESKAAPESSTTPTPTPAPPDEKPSPPPAAEQKPEPKAEAPKPEAAPKPSPGPTSETPIAQESASPLPEKEYPLPPKIDPQLFTVTQTAANWPNDLPLLEFPDDNIVHTWTLRNAFEGVLILGRTGSGKTSGSGLAFAEAFLRNGFGGLVLTVKKNEADYWRRLCAHCGRENDLIVVQRGGEWKLNVLAYEAQHPGQGAGLSENLTTFCRNLLRISSRSRGPQHSDQVWELAGDQLLNATFDLFLLAGGGITFDRLADFVAAAPTEDLPTTEEDWLKIPAFGAVLVKAKKSLLSLEDKRIFQRATGYWFKIFADYPSKMRASVTLGIYAMLDAFRGRDVPALISSETNVTPESIMSGNIVVVDLPLKELRHTGLMVQSAWKFLFQTALERQDAANSPARRPVFLWEDEAQYFFSDHDHHFQDTARSSRVSRVILTQNLQSFYKELGRESVAITNSIFGNLNTKVFHNNSDPTTNEWAAKHFGQEIHSRLTINHNPPAPPPLAPNDLAGALSRAFDPPSSAGISTTEHWEYAVRPEEFELLRYGGPENDFLVDAYLTWLGAANTLQRHFTFMTFAQNPDL